VEKPPLLFVLAIRH